ncbi:MAG TPA: FAD/NAD(P)-binding oxidoreductase [Anaeromyxobacter sp.]|nr:FAD/NAD(P)-binding oxidoreductase [Anaeromyxobacter sp.]
MSDTRHLIVGGGMTGHAAAQAIRELDPHASIELVGAEPHRPYARPPLTKGLWLGKPEESIWLPEVPGLSLHLGRRVVSIDPAGREVRDDQGAVHRFDRLLLATGGTPRRLPFGGDRVIYLRTLADQRKLRAVQGRRVVVIGGGFIGSEIAASLAQSEKEVTLLFPEGRIGARAYPADLSEFVTRTFVERGVRVLAGQTVKAIEERGEATVVRTGSGEDLLADVVVAGLGVTPEMTLARAAGLLCSDGVEVDERLETSAPGVFAAGDVARFPSGALGLRIRVEHEDAALSTGRAAGRNMAGAGERYEHLPFFYSDMFDLGYEAVGLLDARLETVAAWKTPFKEGTVYYLDANRVRGVLSWGIFGQMDAARALISGRRPVARAELTETVQA